MATYRVHTTKDYTIMSNAHLRDTELSLKAKGLLSVMLSLPETWDYSMNGLCAICKENITAVKSALKELQICGYLVITKIMPDKTESGRIEYVYDIYETRKQAVEKQGVENLSVENHTQLNTYKSITEELITENKKKESKKKNSFDLLIADYSKGNEEITDLLQEWLKVRKAKRAAMTDRAIKMNLEKIDSLAKESGMPVVEYLKEVICRGWAAFYPITNFGAKKGKVYGETGIEIKPNAVDDLAGIF